MSRKPSQKGTANPEDDIEVIQTSTQNNKLTIAERQELFITWARTFGEPVWFFEQMGDILDKINRDETFREMPDLLMLKIRKLCSFPCCIPIVGKRRAIPVVQDIIAKLGSAEKAQKSSFSVLTHFVTRQNFIYADSLDLKGKTVQTANYASADNFEVAYRESMDVVGIKLIDAKELQSYDWEIFAKLPGPVSLIKSGLFSVEFLNMVVFKPYEAAMNKLFELIPGGLIQFEDESSAGEKCKDALAILINMHHEITTASSEWILHNKLDLIRSDTKLDTLSNDLRKQIVPTKTGIVKDQDQKLSNPMEKYLSLISDILPVYSAKFNSSVWFDLISLGRMDLISRIYLRSIDYEDKELPKFLEQISEQQVKYLKSASDDLNHQNKLWDRRYHELRFRWFYINKFGFEKFEEMLALIPKNLVDTAEMRNYIQSRETKIIDLELARYDRFEQTQTVNKEAWVELARLMRYESSRPAKLELYKKLRKFILPADLSRAPRSFSDTKALKETDYLRSKSDFPIICPHVRDMMELSGHDHNQNDSLRDYLVSNYSTQDTLLDDAYYCRICGEVLITTDQMGLTNSIRAEGYSHNEDELKKYIWKQVNWLLRAEIEFKELRSDQDTKTVIRDIVGRIHPFIEQIEKKLLKSKTMTNEEYENYKRILTIIYTYAILIRIILDNSKEIKFKSFDFNRKPNVDKMIKYATDQIIDSQNVIINTMKNITAEYIGSMLVKAYDGISDYVGKTKMQAPEPMSLVDYIVADPLYWFLVRQWWSTSLSGAKPELRCAQLALPDHILGQSISKIESIGGAIFEKAPNPLARAPAWDQSALASASKSGIGILRDAWHARMGSCARWLLDYTKSGVYLLPVWQVTIEPSPAGDIIKVNRNPDYIKFDSAHDTFDLDQTISNLWQTFRCPPYSNLYTLKQSRNYGGFTEGGYQYIAYTHGTAEQDLVNKKIIKPDAPVCASHLHDWKYYAFVELDSYKHGAPLSSYKKPVIVARGTAMPEISGQIMLDQYCGICFKAWSTVPNPDIRADLEQSQTIGGFYNYYSKVCPEQKDQSNTMHDFGKTSYDAMGKCKLCGFNKLFYDNKDVKFFKQYLSRFKQSVPVPEFETTKFELHKPMSAIDKWKFNPNLMNEFVQITYDLLKGGTTTETGMLSFNFTKTEYSNVIANLGLITGYDYDQIKRGTKTPGKDLTSKNSLIRRTVLHSYIQTILIELSRIVNPSSRDPTLDKILDQINKADLTKLNPELIQSDMGNYYDISNYIATLEPAIQADYTYEYLLQLILNTHNIMSKTKSKYKNDITIYLTTLILNSDESTSRIKPQRVAAIEATNQSNKDPNVVDNDQTRMFDTLVDPDASDKYGFEEMDYDADNEEFERAKDF